MHNFMETLLKTSLIGLLLLLTGCATNPATGEQDIVLMSEQEEIALGRQAHQEVLKQYGVYEDKSLQQYVQSVGNKLARKSHRQDLIFRFTVLDSKQVNAFALPGGYIYITRGLMAYLNSEAELAAVLGHEIGHVTARHSVRQYSAAQLANIGAMIGSIFVPGMNTTIGNQLTQLFGTALLRGYGREHELEADRLGAEYLARTGYTPKAMIDVITVLKSQEQFEIQRAKQEGREPNTYHGLFATHPKNDTRLQEIVGLADSLQSKTTPAVGVEPYFNSIDGLIFGDSPKEGITRGNSFYHRDLGFALNLPKGWNVTNQPDRLIVAAPEGKALIQLTAEDINKRISPRQFMIERLGLNELRNERSLNIHGSEAHTGTSSINTNFGRRESRFTVLYFNQMAYVFAGITKEKGKIAEYDTTFLKSMQSFHALTKNEQQLAKPLQLDIIKASADTNYKALSQTSPLLQYAEEEIRLLNDHYPKGTPTHGQLIKIIQ